MARPLLPSVFLLGLAGLGLAACDRVYEAHVTGRMLSPSTKAGALVVPLEGAKRAFPVDPASGRFVGTYGALNVHPNTIPLLAHVPGARPFVLMPGRDFELVEQGGAFRAELDVDPRRARPSRTLPLACTADACTAELPPGAEGCRSTVIVIDGMNATLVAPGAERLPEGGLRLVALFPLPRNRPRSLVVVSTCGDVSYVSDLATFDGP